MDLSCASPEELNRPAGRQSLHQRSRSMALKTIHNAELEVSRVSEPAGASTGDLISTQ